MPTDRTASQPRFEPAVEWDVRIPARDGVELSANIWRPAGHAAGPVPAILEMIPYGKDNWRRNADTARGEWFAARGYALCRVDVRGTGSSGGVALDEYTEDETRDGFDAVEWLAAQPWCTGAVGMWGISYGGFTAIQVAKLRPPHLRAIVPVQATDDRYRTDVHYLGGCVTASELSQYAVSQVAMNAMPPDASFRGDAWLDEWRARLEATPPWLVEWLRQQTDGPYWRPGSLAPDYDAIDAAILSIGGWCDAYVDAAFRMQARCTAPTRTLVGNWVHGWPQDSPPGPNLDELHEVVRFFDRWLRDEAERPRRGAGGGLVRARLRRAGGVPGVVAGPLAGGRRVSRIPRRSSGHSCSRAGRCRSPAGSWSGVRWRPGSTPIGTERRSARAAACRGAPAGSRTDWRAISVRTRPWVRCSRRAPLVEPLSILGEPVAILHLTVDAPVATAVVRLADVAPDGTSSWVSAGILNLTHRRSDTDPEPLVPGELVEVRVPLRHAGYRFEPGHAIRVSVASSAWPVIWPSPYPATFSLHRGDATPSRVELPVIPAAGGPSDRPVPSFKTSPPDLREVGGGGVVRRAAVADRGGRDPRHDHGHDPRRWRGRPRGRPAPLCRRDASVDGVGPRARRRNPRRRRRLPLDRCRPRHRDPRDGASRRAMPRRSTWAWT